MPNPLQVISRSRAELERVDTAALYQLIAAYAPMKGRVDARIDALLAEIEAMENPTVASVRRLSSFRTLSSDIDDGMSGYVQFLIIALGAAATQGIDLGVRHGADILAAYEAGSVYRVSPDAVRVALQFLEPTGALMDRIRMLAPYTAEQVRRSILDGIAQGLNPRTIATNVTRSFGIGLTDSMRMLRTAQIYSYRYANHASYLANGIESWVWVSRLDPARTCFLAGTMIVTARGRVPIESVVVGDVVLTHTGAWRRVTETMSREYGGKMVEIVSHLGSVSATADHPVLVVRNGRAEWMEMSNVVAGDNILYCGEHVGINSTVEAGVADSKYAKAKAGEFLGFSGVPFSDIFTVVPVLAVNFYDQVEFRDKEVHGVSVPGRGIFLDKLHAKYLQALSKVRLRGGLARVAAVTLRGAEFLVSKRWHYAKILLAMGALNNSWRPAAKLAAVVANFARLAIKWLSAPLATCVVAFLARSRAMGRAVNNSLLRWEYSKLVATLRANLLGARGRAFAGHAAILSTPPIAGSPECATARGAHEFHRWAGNLASRGVGMLGLMLGVAVPRTELASAFGDPRGMGIEFYGARFADTNNHPYILPYSTATHTQGVRVYNIEVEEDHSYIADGFVVHNCPSCVAKHGSIHPATETLQDHHNGLCLAAPIAGGYNPVNETGEEWFSQQSASTQMRMLGKGRYEAWSDGKFPFDALSKGHEDSVYGTMFVATPLKELVP